MPRVSLDPKNNKYRKLTILINGAVAADGKNVEEIGRLLGVCRQTASKYLMSPEIMPLETLLKVTRSLGIPIEELRECIRYQ